MYSAHVACSCVVVGLLFRGLLDPLHVLAPLCYRVGRVKLDSSWTCLTCPLAGLRLETAARARSTTLTTEQAKSGVGCSCAGALEGARWLGGAGLSDRQGGRSCV